MLILAIASLALAIGLFREAGQAQSNPNIYHFGSEAMVGEGGDHYRSQQTYIEHFQFLAAIAGAAFVIFFGTGYFIFRKIRVR